MLNFQTLKNNPDGINDNNIHPNLVQIATRDSRMLSRYIGNIAGQALEGRRCRLKKF